MRPACLFPTAAAALLLGAAAQAGQLPPYPEALRCAALTEAWTRQVDKGSAEGLARFDKAIFWGMAASEAARKAKLPASRFTADQEREGAAAFAQLEARDAGAVAELAACAERVPPRGELGRLRSRTTVGA